MTVVAPARGRHPQAPPRRRRCRPSVLVLSRALTVDASRASPPARCWSSSPTSAYDIDPPPGRLCRAALLAVVAGVALLRLLRASRSPRSVTTPGARAAAAAGGDAAAADDLGDLLPDVAAAGLAAARRRRVPARAPDERAPARVAADRRADRLGRPRGARALGASATACSPRGASAGCRRGELRCTGYGSTGRCTVVTPRSPARALRPRRGAPDAGCARSSSCSRWASSPFSPS